MGVSITFENKLQTTSLPGLSVFMERFGNKVANSNSQDQDQSNNYISAKSGFMNSYGFLKNSKVNFSFVIEGLRASDGREFRNGVGDKTSYIYDYSPLTSNGEASGLFINNSLEVKQSDLIDSAISKFIELSRSEYFEYGYTQPSERFLLQFSQEHPNSIGNLVQSIYLRKASDTIVTLALLNAVASIDYSLVYPYGQMLAIGALTNPAIEVKEAAIRVYESWGHKEGAAILKEVDCPWGWLDEYRRQVIADLGGDA